MLSISSLRRVARSMREWIAGPRIRHEANVTLTAEPAKIEVKTNTRARRYWAIRTDTYGQFFTIDFY
jgi:hypothetical protein